MSDPVTEPLQTLGMTLEEAAIAYVQAKRAVVACSGPRTEPPYKAALAEFQRAMTELDRAASRVEAAHRRDRSDDRAGA